MGAVSPGHALELDRVAVVVLRHARHQAMLRTNTSHGAAVLLIDSTGWRKSSACVAAPGLQHGRADSIPRAESVPTDLERSLSAVREGEFEDDAPPPAPPASLITCRTAA